VSAPPPELRALKLTGLALAAAVALVGGCGEDAEPGDTTEADRSTITAAEPRPKSPPPPPTPLESPPCPPATANCEEASGTVLHVERADPDGDGDAHFVLLGRAGVTGPGISVIDVRADLRPEPLPGPGDQLAASGPVYSGSFGQDQIQADQVVTGP